MAVPSAPTITSVTSPFHGHLKVEFDPPASDGGSPVLRYTVKASRTDWGSNGRTDIVKRSYGLFVHLPAGTYNCTVTATNADGTSPASVVVQGAPGFASAPSAPTNVALELTAAPPPDWGGSQPDPRTSVSGALHALWTPAASTGGAPIQHYEVRVYQGASQVRTVNVGAWQHWAPIEGLTNGVSYTVRVRTHNAARLISPESTASPAVAPANGTALGVPGAPTSLSANSASVGNATVTFSAPASNGGKHIEYYTASCGAVSNTVGAAPSGSPLSAISLSGLPSGSQTITVRAHNMYGDGAIASTNTTVL